MRELSCVVSGRGEKRKITKFLIGSFVHPISDVNVDLLLNFGPLHVASMAKAKEQAARVFPKQYPADVIGMMYR
jgi:hypothetical protein